MNQAKSTITISAQNLAFFAGIPGHQQRKPDAADPQPSGAWSRLINEKLVAWAQNPRQFEDDDITVPSAATISRASLVASSLRDQGAPAPSRIVPTGDGGIAFQYDSDPEFISIEVEPDGPVELLVFNKGRLTHRAEL